MAVIYQGPMVVISQDLLMERKMVVEYGRSEKDNRASFQR